MRRLVLPLLVAAIAAVAPVPALAQQDPCAGETQTAMNICAADRVYASFERLSGLLSELYASSDSARAAELRRVQRAWEEYAKRHCEWTVAPNEGGSAQPMFRDYCLAELAEQRIVALRPLLCGSPMSDCPKARRYPPPAWMSEGP